MTGKDNSCPAKEACLQKAIQKALQCFWCDREETDLTRKESLMSFKSLEKKPEQTGHVSKVKGG